MPNKAIILTGLNLNTQEDDCACPDRAFVLTFWHNDTEVDNDCACPDRAFNLICESPPAPTFTQPKNVLTTPLPNDFHLAFSPYAPQGPSVLNAEAWMHWQTFQQPTSLKAAIDQTFLDQKLIIPFGQSPKPTALQSHTLTAWVHISNACNLECPYCYVRKSSERMSEAIGRRALQSIFDSAQKNGFKRVKLKYAGGEATLHFQLVRRLHEYAQTLAQETGLGLKEVVLSNGVHLRVEDADWLRENGVKLMISLDGIGALHDQLRPQKDGGETFSHVAHTIDQVLLPRGIRPDITMTVTRLNAHGAAEVARWALIERDLPLSFNFYRQNILSASWTELNLEEQTIIEGMLAAYAVIEQHLPSRSFFNGLLDRVQAEAHSHTCGVGQSYVVVTHTGQLAQCQMHLDQPLAPIGDADLLPMLATGPLQNISVDEKTGCRDCEFRYRCSGGCPLETWRVTGRWDVQSPNCRIYKTLLPHALRLEGLRLMKVNGYLH